MDFDYENYNYIISDIVKKAKEYNFKPEIIEYISDRCIDRVDDTSLITKLLQNLASDLYHKYIFKNVQGNHELTRNAFRKGGIVPLLNINEANDRYYIQLITQIILPLMAELKDNLTERGFNTYAYEEESTTVSCACDDEYLGEDEAVEEKPEQTEDEESALLQYIGKHCESKELDIDFDDLYSYMNGPTSALLSVIDHPSEKDHNAQKTPYAGYTVRQQVSNIIELLQQVIVANSAYPDKQVAKDCYQYTLRLNDIITYIDRMPVTPKTLIYRAFYGVIYYFPSALSPDGNFRLKLIKELEKTIRWYKNIDIWLNVLHGDVVNRIATEINTTLHK